MDQALSKVFTASGLVVLAGVVSIAACTRTTDRVVEPVGGPDAATPTPTVEDGGVDPIGPIARPIEQDEDFRLVRAPEFGAPPERARLNSSADLQGIGGSNFGGSAGIAGGDARPVRACGGSSSYY